MPHIEERNGKFRARVMINRKMYTKTFRTRHAAEKWADHKEAERINAAEDERLISLVPRPIMEAIEAAEFTHPQILHGAIPVGTLSGVYFLIQDGEVVYVGQTRNVFHRLGQHTRGGMEFDGYNFIPCQLDKLDELEKMYLMALWPKYNRRFSA